MGRFGKGPFWGRSGVSPFFSVGHFPFPPCLAWGGLTTGTLSACLGPQEGPLPLLNTQTWATVFLPVLFSPPQEAISGLKTPPLWGHLLLSLGFSFAGLGSVGVRSFLAFFRLPLVRFLLAVQTPGGWGFFFFCCVLSFGAIPALFFTWGRSNQVRPFFPFGGSGPLP